MTSAPPSLRALLDSPGFRGALLVALAGFIVFARLGHGHLANYDDCYYAEKAREMVRDGHWLAPHYDGYARMDNPPLFLWLMAGAFTLGGVNDYAAVFLSALSGVLCVGLMLRLGPRLGLDPFESWAAALVLLGTQYFLKYSRHAMFDVFLTLLFLAGMLAYRRAAEGRMAAWLWLGALTGLSVLTKSVLGLFPLLVAALHLLWTHRLRALRDPGPWAALAVALLVAAPWFVAMHLRYPDRFVDEHFGWLLWKRAFVLEGEGQTWGRRLQYAREIAMVYWPWLPLALWGVWNEGRAALARGADGGAAATAPGSRAWTARLLLVWLLVVVGVLSLANEKKLWYAMSAFPCLAFFAARAAGAWLPSAAARARAVRWGLAVTLVAAAVLNLTPIGESRPRRPDLQQLALVARESAPRGRQIANLDAAYWAISNQFLFYSERPISLPLGDPAAVRARLAAGDWALLTVAGYARVSGADSAAYPAVARCGQWVLAKAAPPEAPTLPARGR